FPDEIKNEVDILAEFGFRRAQNALRDDATNDVGYRKGRLIRSYAAEHLLARALLQNGFGNPGLVEIQRLEFRIGGRMDAEVAQFGVVDLEEVPVFVAVRQLDRDQSPQLAFDGRLLFQLLV